MGRISVGMSSSPIQQRCVCRLGVSASPSHHKPIISSNILKRETLARAATQRTGATIEINPVDLSNVAYEV